MNVMSIIPDLTLNGDSIKFKNWQSLYLDIKTCQDCRRNHGKIYPYSAKRYQPKHIACRCSVIPMRTMLVGCTTERGYDGADAWLMFRGKLPNYYVTKAEAKSAGWNPKKQNLCEVLPGKMIGGDVYYNHPPRLPEAEGRVWYEADFDFVDGYRNKKRILYSNDGLIFASYDHAQTFHEIVKEKPKNARYI